MQNFSWSVDYVMIGSIGNGLSVDELGWCPKEGAS